MQVTVTLGGFAALGSRHPREGGDLHQHALHTAFSHALDRLGPFGPAPHLAVALSGGADSMACALLAHAWVTARSGRLTTLTVDHALRPESRQEAEQVAAWMQERNIPHYILTPPQSDASNNLQENARQRRYDALAGWCRGNDVLHCLVAHTASDQRETVAHNLARGDTADGASGMAALRNHHGIRFLRPMLHLERDALEKFLHAHAACWVEDPSNRNTDFARVRTRRMLRQDTARRDELTAMTRHEGPARALRDNALAHAAARLVTLHPAGHAELSLAGWKALEPELAAQLLADLLRTVGMRPNRPRKADTLRLCDALRSDFKRRTLHHCDIRTKGDTLHIRRDAAHDSGPFTPLKPLAATPFWWLNQG